MKALRQWWLGRSLRHLGEGPASPASLVVQLERCHHALRKGLPPRTSVGPPHHQQPLAAWTLALTPVDALPVTLDLLRPVLLDASPKGRQQHGEEMTLWMEDLVQRAVAMALENPGPTGFQTLLQWSGQQEKHHGGWLKPGEDGTMRPLHLDLIVTARKVVGSGQAFHWGIFLDHVLWLQQQARSSGSPMAIATRLSEVILREAPLSCLPLFLLSLWKRFSYRQQVLATSLLVHLPPRLLKEGFASLDAARAWGEELKETLLQTALSGALVPASLVHERPAPVSAKVRMALAPLATHLMGCASPCPEAIDSLPPDMMLPVGTLLQGHPFWSTCLVPKVEQEVLSALGKAESQERRRQRL